MLLHSAQTGRSLDALWPDTTASDVLDDRAFETPRVASLFLLIAHGHWFRHLYVATQRFRSTLFRAPGKAAWLHVVRDTGRRP